MPLRRLAIALAAALAASAAQAHDYRLGDLAIAHPFALAAPPGAPVAGGYLTIENAGAEDDALIAVTVDASVAGAAELHAMTMEGGIMRMSPVEGGIPVPAGETVTLEPGGLHVMLTRLTGGLAEGQVVPATLTFERAGEIAVEFHVEARGARDAGAHDHGAHDH